MSFVLGTVAPSPVPVVPTPISMWEAQAGDRLVVDTQANMGYLIHKNGEFTSFEVASGQRRTVHYIGRTYFAATPPKKWTAKTMEIKGDRFTYGPTGTFFRLFDDEDNERTAYGIHTFKNEETMFSGERYGSMGCIIIPQTLLPLFIKTFELNENELKVVTTYGFDSLIAQAVPQVSLSQ